LLQVTPHSLKASIRENVQENAGNAGISPAGHVYALRKAIEYLYNTAVSADEQRRLKRLTHVHDRFSLSNAVHTDEHLGDGVRLQLFGTHTYFMLHPERFRPVRVLKHVDIAPARVDTEVSTTPLFTMHEPAVYLPAEAAAPERDGARSVTPSTFDTGNGGAGDAGAGAAAADT
jgi:hypothetical protein